LTYRICEYIAQTGYNIALDVTSGVAVESKDPGDHRGVSTTDLKFTGSIFIYHEWPLLSSEIDGIVPLFKSNGLSPQFRGHDYELSRNNPIVGPPRVPPRKQ
jgi:hypothetical protein